MTDEQMDARLRRGGEAWRAAIGDAPPQAQAVLDPEPLMPRPLSSPPARQRRIGLLASAAVVAAALVAGGAVFIASVSGHGKQTADTAALEGTVWQLTGYDDQGSHVPSGAVLYIGRDGRLVADQGCLLLGAEAQISDRTITFADLDVRRDDCKVATVPGSGHQFTAAVFHGRVSYALAGRELTVTGGGHTMKLTAAPELPAPTLDVPTFLGSTWRLVRASDADGNDVTIAGNPTLQVDRGRLTATTPCNTLTGPVEINGQQVRLGDIRSTVRPCPGTPAEMAVEHTFGGKTLHEQVSGTQLTVSGDRGGQLVYDWMPADEHAVDPHRLAEHDWQLASIAGEPAPKPLRLAVGGASGSLSFEEGCGWNGGDVRIGRGTLRLTGERSQPLSECTGDTRERAATLESYFAQQPALWRIQDDKLIIYGGGPQALALVYVRVGPPQPAAVPLIGTNWVLSSIVDANKHDVAIAGNASLRIDQSHHLTGNDACNAISGTVGVNGATISFGNGLATTAIACSENRVTATAEHVDAVLSGDVTWSVDGDTLTLANDGVGALVYQAVSSTKISTDPNDLIGKTWNLTTIELGTVAHTVTGKPTLRIDSGAIAFTDGCNADKGKATVGNGTIDLSHVGGTYAYCTQSTEVMSLLTGHVTWAIEDRQLTMTKSGTGALVYELAEPAIPTNPQLVGTPWKLTGAEVQHATGGSGSGSSDTGITLTIAGDGTYRLETKCGVEGGSVAVAGHSVTFGDPHTIKDHSCPAPDETDKALRNALDVVLNGAATWTVNGSTLTLVKDGTTLTFSAS